jgi:hypothetical protein
MSGLVVAVANGLVDLEDCDKATFQRIRSEVRVELRAYRIKLPQLGDRHGDRYRLQRNYRKKHRTNNTPIFTGPASFVECCRRALPYIEPSNPER